MERMRAVLERLTVVTRKGQITITAEIRRALGLKEGDKVAISLPNPVTREVHLHPVRTVAEMTFGAVSPRKRPEEFRELREIFKDEIVDKELENATAANNE
jgi:AbrB family looped-hinge helix DNA binding protein